MISARAFLASCQAQARVDKEEATQLKPVRRQRARERAGAARMNKNANPESRSGLAIDPSRIEWIEADGGHSRVFTSDGSCLVRRSLQELEKAWLANRIILISPSIMVNARRIRELRACPRRACELVLESGKRFSCAFPFTLPLSQVMHGMHAMGSDS
jgi:DNA-binding LytR/AlgR family response regulator